MADEETREVDDFERQLQAEWTSFTEEGLEVCVSAPLGPARACAPCAC
jgi:hypothetical protein